jgi:hypothetical protein
MIAFFPRSEALALLDQHYENEAAAGEYEAELGSDFFYSGLPSWEATSLARQRMDQAREDFERSAEGQEYMERLEAARFMLDATHGLSVADREDLLDHRIFVPRDSQVVPEFYPDGPHRSMFGPVVPNHDDIPF